MCASLKVWFLAPEVAPFAKTGGLADVAGTLPGCIKDLGVDIKVGMPFYRMVKEGDFHVRTVFEHLDVTVGNTRVDGRVLETSSANGVNTYLFDVPELFDRPGLYGTERGDYPDNLERFTCFCHAALLFAKQAGLGFDLVHCHDWQTGLVPVYLKTLYRHDPFFSNVSSIFTVHNMGYQGLFPGDRLFVCGVPATEFHPGGLEYWSNISLLKAGILYADAVTTVSPRYSAEIQSPEFGMGMDEVLRRRSADLYGILNGADYSVWNPATDKHLPKKYSPVNMAGKYRCKEFLVQELGLDTAMRDKPLLGMISRLDVQKGFDLVLHILDDIMELDLGLVILGAGDEKIQDSIQHAAERHRGRLGFKFGFDERLAHRIMAGSDMLLIPSRYEPCGLVQIYGLKYGTVPIVRTTGGLDDTITHFDPRSGEGNGFKFADYEAGAFFSVIKDAIEFFEDKPRWKKLIKNGMKEDFSWEKSARQYIELYRKIRK